MSATTPRRRLRGHRIEKMAVNGGIIAGCSCGRAEYRPVPSERQRARGITYIQVWNLAPEMLRDALMEQHQEHLARVALLGPIGTPRTQLRSVTQDTPPGVDV